MVPVREETVCCVVVVDAFRVGEGECSEISIVEKGMFLKHFILKDRDGQGLKVYTKLVDRK